jgi:MFS family permease
VTDSGYGGYGALLAVSPRARMVIAGLLARTPIAVLGFGFLYFAHARTGTYAIGGLTSGLAIASMGLIGPFAGRIADRRGQRQLLLVSAVLHPVAIAAAIVAGYLGATVPLVIMSVLCGVTVAPVGAFMRARWASLVEDAFLLRTAFAIEAVADEIVWVFGPAIAAFLASGVAVSGGLILSGILGPLGALVLRMLPDAKPAPRRAAGSRPFRLLASVPLMVLMGGGFLVGIGFGINDLSIVSMAIHSGVPELAGTVLTVYSIGSATGGLIFGSISRRFRSRPMLVGTCTAFFVAWAPLALAPDIWWFYPLGLFAGATIAPFMIAMNHTVAQLVPQEIVTEALAWLSTVIVVGMSLGSIFGGLINDATTPRTAFLVVATASFLALLLTVSAFRAFGGLDRGQELRP